MCMLCLSAVKQMVRLAGLGKAAWQKIFTVYYPDFAGSIIEIECFLQQ